MAQSAAFLILPACESAEDKVENLQRAARFSAQVLDDLWLAERVLRSLRAAGHGSLCHVAVTVSAGEVVLEGKVPSYYVKQVAQATSLAVPRVQHVCNNLQVDRRK
jgi:osmotically-inducible protein OsmY